MGLICYAVYHIGLMIIKSNVLWTLIAIIFAVVAYGLALILTKTISKEELYSVPKGGMIVNILEKIHLL